MAQHRAHHRRRARRAPAPPRVGALPWALPRRRDSMTGPSHETHTQAEHLPPPSARTRIVQEESIPSARQRLAQWAVTRACHHPKRLLQDRCKATRPHHRSDGVHSRCRRAPPSASHRVPGCQQDPRAREPPGCWDTSRPACPMASEQQPVAITSGLVQQGHSTMCVCLIGFTPMAIRHGQASVFLTGRVTACSALSQWMTSASDRARGCIPQVC